MGRFYTSTCSTACNCFNLVDQTTPSTALDVLHHQHAEGGSGQSGTVFVTDVGM